LSSDDNLHEVDDQLVQRYDTILREVIVGHQPLLGQMVNDMIHNEKSNACNLLLKKVRVVRIRLLRKSNAPKGELRWLLTPRILKNIYKKDIK
jgi:phosphohistidine phosphatase SixA